MIIVSRSEPALLIYYWIQKSALSKILDLLTHYKTRFGYKAVDITRDISS